MNTMKSPKLLNSTFEVREVPRIAFAYRYAVNRNAQHVVSDVEFKFPEILCLTVLSVTLCNDVLHPSG